MRTIALLCVATACASQPHLPEAAPATPCAAGQWPDEPVVIDVTVGSTPRRGLVWMPSGPGPHDVIVLMHEFRSEPLRTAHYTGWLGFAREKNAILLAPDGKAATWNASGCCGAASDRKIDDITFLDAAVARLDAVGCTTGRVLATGIGNGGMMAQQWACQSEVPDAVISVGGALQVQTCPAKRPIPLVHLHGEADDFLPASGEPGLIGFKTTPVATALEVWRARNGATAAPEVFADGDLRCEQWAGAASITACTVAGMEDLWPGAADTTVRSAHPLKDATRGAWAWLDGRWPADAAR
jgi:polyhydroxybutyrate depolymerase